MPLKILLRILSFCDWYALMKVSRTSRRGRAAVQYQIWCRLETKIRPFLPNAPLNTFIQMLDDTGAAVVGSICRRLLASGSEYIQESQAKGTPVSDKSFDLNLLVPAKSFARCLQWFASQGYVTGGGEVEWAYGRAVSEVVNAYMHSVHATPLDPNAWRPRFLSDTEPPELPLMFQVGTLLSFKEIIR